MPTSKRLVATASSTERVLLNNTGKANDANDGIIYDKDSGKLYYDRYAW